MIHAFDRIPRWLDLWKASGGITLLLDFDGTLAPIVDHPEGAEPTAGARLALEQLLQCEGVKIAVVSGRSLADVRDRVGIAGIHYAGNHGLEMEGPSLSLVVPEAARARPLLLRALDQLSPDIAAIPGAQIEDKGLTLTIHYRRADPAAAPQIREIVIRAVREAPGLTITEGKKVLEIRPEVAWGKGEAVTLLLRRLPATWGSAAIYVGDDLTDEGGFSAAGAWVDGEGSGVLVGTPPPAGTAATSYVESPERVAVLLSLLLNGRPASR